MALPDKLRWDVPEAATTVLSTELNSLAVDAISTASAAQDQDAAQYPFADFELNVTFAAAPVAGEVLELVAQPTIDGTNFPTSSVDSYGQLLAIFQVLPSASAQRVRPMGGPFQLPAWDFKLALINRTSQAFPASGSTVKMTRYGPSVID